MNAPAPRSQERITSYWDAHADDYDAHPLSRLHVGPMAVTWTRTLAEALPAPPAEVLEVGCGTGQMTYLLAAAGFRVAATDLSAGMLARAGRRCAGLPSPPRLLIDDAVDPAFPDGSFDAVVCRYLLWTLRRPAEAIANWHRVLRPGGVLVAIDANWFASGSRPGQDGDITADDRTFLDYYDERVFGDLPLAEASTTVPVVALVRQAGFADLSLTHLDEVHRHESAAQHEVGDVRRQYRLRAVRR